MLELWDISDLPPVYMDKVHELTAHTEAVTDLAFSHDGNRIASASFDNTVRAWETETGLELLNLPGHTGVMWDVAFSPDDSYLATASWDGTVQVYVLDLEELIELGYSRLTRWWTTEECRQYLQRDECPERPDS